MVTLLYSDAEYHAFYANLRRNVKLARKTLRTIKKSSSNRRSLKKARRNLSKAKDLRNSFASVASNLVCEVSGIPVEEFQARNLFAVKKGEAYRTFLSDGDWEKYLRQIEQLKAELAHTIGLIFPNGIIFPLPLYKGSQSSPSSGEWISLYGGQGTTAVTELGEVSIQDIDEHTKRIVVSGAILKRPDVFFLVSDRFLGDPEKVRVINKGASRMAKVANGYSVGELSLGGSYVSPCFCSDCPGTNINSNCDSGCCTRPDE